MKSFRDRNPYIVGMASVGVIAVFVGIAFFVGLSHALQNTYTMSGVFADSGGIAGGDNVLVAGRQAGPGQRGQGHPTSRVRAAGPSRPRRGDARRARTPAASSSPGRSTRASISAPTPTPRSCWSRSSAPGPSG